MKSFLKIVLFASFYLTLKECGVLKNVTSPPNTTGKPTQLKILQELAVRKARKNTILDENLYNNYHNNNNVNYFNQAFNNFENSYGTSTIGNFQHSRINNFFDFLGRTDTMPTKSIHTNNNHRNDQNSNYNSNQIFAEITPHIRTYSKSFNPYADMQYDAIIPSTPQNLWYSRYYFDLTVPIRAVPDSDHERW